MSLFFQGKKETGDGDGLVAFWPMDDAVGTFVAHEEVSGNDGALQNGARFVYSGSQASNLCELSNANQGARVAYPGPRLYRNVTFTLRCYVIRSSGQVVFYQQSTSASIIYGCFSFQFSADNHLVIGLRNSNVAPDGSATVLIGPEMPVSDWYDLAYVLDYDTGAATIVLGTTQQSFAGACVGELNTSAPAGYFSGAPEASDSRGFSYLKNLRLHDRALTYNEIQDVFSGNQPI